MFPNVVLTPTQINDLLLIADAPVPATPVTDIVLPPAKWKMNQSPYVEVNLRTREIGAIPQTQYGSAAYVNEGFEQHERIYKPRSIKQVGVIPGNVANDMQTKEPNFLNNEIARILANQRDIVRETKEAMLCLALKGTHTYPVNTAAGVILATQTAMAAVAAPTISLKWDASGAKFSYVDTAWRLFQDAIIAATDGVYGRNANSLVMLVGDDVWGALVPLLTAHFANSGSALIEPSLRTREFAWANMRIKNISGTYRTFSGTTVSTAAKITAKAAYMVDLAAQHQGRYCTLEDIGAGNRAMEFFAKQWENQNPSGLNIQSESKPFVFPDTRAIAIQDVLS